MSSSALVSVASAYLDGLRACPLTLEVEPGARGQGKARPAREQRAAVISALRALGMGATFPDQAMDVVAVGEPGEPAFDATKLPLLDLPIAVGMLARAGQVPVSSLDGVLFLGDLRFDGALRASRGVLALLRGLVLRKYVGRVVIPLSALHDAALLRGHVPDLEIRGASSLREVVSYLRGEDPLCSLDTLPTREGAPASEMLPIPAGMEVPMEIAAAGGIPLLALGDTGRNDASLGRWLCALLPPLKVAERVEHAAILSTLGLGAATCADRPVRVPHFTVSSGGMFAASSPSGARPGEVSLAHHGVLVLSDVGAFRRSILDDLVRGKEHDLDRGFPARTRWIATSPLCYCGATRTMVCACNQDSRERYLTRLMELPVYPAAMVVPVTGDSHMASPVASAKRVAAARAFAVKRAHRVGMTPTCPEEVWGGMDARVPLPVECREMVQRALEIGLLHPGAEKVTKRIARAIADLAQHPGITFDDMERAIRLAPFQIKLPV